MTITASRRQLFADVPVKEVEKQLHISAPRYAFQEGVSLAVTIGTGSTIYSISYRDEADFTVGTVITLTNNLNNKQQRWEII